MLYFSFENVYSSIAIKFGLVPLADEFSRDETVLHADMKIYNW